MSDDWQPLTTAPRDGTEIELTSPSGETWPMRWTGRVWIMRSAISGTILTTWCEKDPDGAPTHWRHKQEGNVS